MNSSPFRSRAILGLLAVAALLLLLLWFSAEERVRLLATNTAVLAANTAVLAAGTCAISLPLGTVLALLLVRTDLPARRGVGLLLVLLLFLPIYVQAAAWQAALGVQGVFARQGILDGMPAAVWIHAVAAVPWVAAIVAAGLLLVEPELEEEALLDASPWRVFFRVTLPRLSPALLAAALWVAMTTAGEMVVTDLFQVRTYAEVIYTSYVVDGTPSAALPGTIFTALLVVAALALFAHLAPPSRVLSTGGRVRYRLGGWKWPALASVGLTLLVIAGVPLLSLLVKAGITVSGPGRVRSWSPTKAASIIAESPIRFRSELGWSLLVAVLAATAALAIATSLAWWARRSRIGGIVLMFVAATFLALPAPVVGLAIIRLLNRPEFPLLAFLYDQSIAGLWLAQLADALPLPLLLMWYSLRSVPAETLDSAALDGAGPLEQLRRIALPSRLPAVACAWLVALAIALAEFGGSTMVYPPRATTLPIRLFDLMHYGVDDRLAGICLAQLAMFALVAWPMMWLVGWAGWLASTDSKIRNPKS
ncbi:MAG: ABC transporter permease subunit [Planctomycetes bacterium]|nr:ABC transporter permease subunit [Planctomycetota bacterium]